MERTTAAAVTASGARMNEDAMDKYRRKVMQSGTGATLLGLLAAAGWLKPARGADLGARPWNRAAFDTHSLADAMQALGVLDAKQSKDIAFVQTPEIAENGAVVPIGISSNIPKTESIAIVIEKIRILWPRSSTSPRGPSRPSRPASRWRKPRTFMPWCGPMANTTSPPRR